MTENYFFDWYTLHYQESFFIRYLILYVLMVRIINFISNNKKHEAVEFDVPLIIFEKSMLMSELGFSFVLTHLPFVLRSFQ